MTDLEQAILEAAIGEADDLLRRLSEWGGLYVPSDARMRSPEVMHLQDEITRVRELLATARSQPERAIYEEALDMKTQGTYLVTYGANKVADRKLPAAEAARRGDLRTNEERRKPTFFLTIRVPGHLLPAFLEVLLLNCQHKITIEKEKANPDV